MAATYGSIATASATNANAVTVTKPSGVALGELLVAIISNGGRNDPATAASLSGWTQISNTNNTANSHNVDVTILARVATAADVSATNYTFSVTNTTDVVLGAIIRVVGFFSSVAASEVDAASDAAPGGAGSFAGLTPNEAGTLLIIGEAVGAGNTNTFSGYAVANNNPTWTERSDFGNHFNDGNGDDFLSMGIATATFSVDTATGNYAVTNSNTAFNNGHAFLISINESPVSVSVSADVVTATASVQAPTVIGGALVAPSVVSAIASIPAPTVTTPDPDWHNTDKSAAPSWINPDKS